MALANPSKMPELEFARKFVGLLDRVPPVRPADFVKDPKDYPSRAPTLLPQPSAANPLAVATLSSSSSGPAEARITAKVTATATKPPMSAHDLGALDLDASVLDVKQLLASRLQQIPASRLRVLFRRKPVADSKIVRELLLSGAGDDNVAAAAEKGLELSFMVTAAAAGAAEAPDQQEERARKMLQTEGFWNDLDGFLRGKLGDEKATAETLGLFRGAVAER